MDGLVELLIILFIVLFPVLETMAKRRRQRSEEEGGAGPPERRDEPRPASVDPGAEPRGPRAGRRGSEERRSEDLLPDDLWEELTGERRGTPGQRAEPAADAGIAGDTARAEERPLESVEEPGGPWEERADTDVEPGAADVPPPEGVIGRSEVGGAEVRRPGEPAAPHEPDQVPGPDRGELLREIGAGEGGLRRRRASELARVRPDRLSRRGAPPPAGREPHPLLGDLDRDALRRAILYREILGPPKALDEEA